MQKISVSLTAALLVTGAACGSTERSRTEESTLFRTDSNSYALRADNMGYSALIDVEFTNSTADTVYFINCNGVTGVTFEKLVDSTWQMAWMPAMNACLSAPIVVPPGSTRRFPTHAFAARRDRAQSGEITIEDAPGTYRIVWPHTVASYQGSPPFGDSLPLSQRVSNRFILRAVEN